MKHRSPAPRPLPLYCQPIPGFKAKSKAASVVRIVNKIARLKVQGGRCPYCTVPLTVRAATVEHRKPISRGGADHLSNIDATCEPCNRGKGSLTRNEFERVIFNPNLKRDGFDLYYIGMEIRLKRRTELACRRLASIITPKRAAA